MRFGIENNDVGGVDLMGFVSERPHHLDAVLRILWFLDDLPPIADNGVPADQQVPLLLGVLECAKQIISLASARFLDNANATIL